MALIERARIDVVEAERLRKERDDLQRAIEGLRTELGTIVHALTTVLSSLHDVVALVG